MFLVQITFHGMQLCLQGDIGGALLAESSAHRLEGLVTVLAFMQDPLGNHRFGLDCCAGHGCGLDLECDGRRGVRILSLFRFCPRNMAPDRSKLIPESGGLGHMPSDLLGESGDLAIGRK